MQVCGHMYLILSGSLSEADIIKVDQDEEEQPTLVAEITWPGVAKTALPSASFPSIGNWVKHKFKLGKFGKITYIDYDFKGESYEKVKDLWIKWNNDELSTVTHFEDVLPV